MDVRALAVGLNRYIATKNATGELYVFPPEAPPPDSRDCFFKCPTSSKKKVLLLVKELWDPTTIFLVHTRDHYNVTRVTNVAASRTAVEKLPWVQITAWSDIWQRWINRQKPTTTEAGSPGAILSVVDTTPVARRS